MMHWLYENFDAAKWWQRAGELEIACRPACEALSCGFSEPAKAMNGGRFYDR